MEEKFKHIDISNEKVDRIINSALEEFSKNKFEKASTNNIVKQAKVSRGLLYHYFEDKQELYDFLVAFSMEVMGEAVKTKMNWEDTDILNRIKQAVMVKYEVALRYPYLTQFFMAVTESLSREKVRDQITDLYPGLRNKFYTHNIDYSRFKDGIDVEKAIDVIRWALEKHAEEYQDKTKLDNVDFDFEAFVKENDAYIEFLRTTFYK